eukprot:TRINITY_DN23813_c0_g1_i2.p1 TRINITY_DN23813_c0_g1~~TRINITY_DN23813_c0_g1_i2.p1  ORF type:complete len:219 (-),score=29.89 TRINITY_DN23813_c0_g1_i2:28-684(-)
MIAYIYPTLIFFFVLGLKQLIKRSKKLKVSPSQIQDDNSLSRLTIQTQQNSHPNLDQMEAVSSSKVTLGMEVISITVIILSFCYKDITEAAIRMFECINVKDENQEEFRLTSDYGVDCQSFSYKVWKFGVATPLIIIVGFMYPIGMLCILLVKRINGKLGYKKILYKYGFFYYAYKQKYFFYDVLILLRKLLVLLNVCLLYTSPSPRDRQKSRMPSSA